MELQAATVGGVTVSPFTLSQQAYEWSGNRWRISCRYANLTRTIADEINAAIVSLYGVGTALLGPLGPSASAPSSWGDTTLLVVSGASQTGKTITVAGFEVETSGKAGAFIQLGSGSSASLHMVIKDFTTSGGSIALDVWPAVRTAPTASSSVVTANPKGVFRLSEKPTWDMDVGHLYSVSFTAEEAF